jgi:hypothetical protein
MFFEEHAFGRGGAGHRGRVGDGGDTNDGGQPKQFSNHYKASNLSVRPKCRFDLHHRDR